MPFDINRGAKVIPFSAKSDRAQTPRVEPGEPVQPATSDLLEISIETPKPGRSADSYSAEELKAMPSDQRAYIEAAQRANGFYRWLDAFEKAWGFPYDARFGMVQKLPHQHLTAQDFESLSRGGKTVAELKAIAARAKKEN